MFGLGATEVIVILVLALIFIGPKKLPELAKGLGKGLREFQKAKDDIMTQVNEEVEDAKLDELIAEKKAEEATLTGVSKEDDAESKKEEESSPTTPGPPSESTSHLQEVQITCGMKLANYRSPYGEVSRSIR